MITDIENRLSLEDDKYDELKAYKIIRKFYDDAKFELEKLNTKYEKNQYQIKQKEDLYIELKNKYDEHSDIFSPSAIRNNTSEELELINHEILSLKETSNYISQSILECTEKVAEYSFVLSVFKKNNIDSESISLSNIDEIINKIDFCISLIEVDRGRVKEELFHVKHLLK